MPWKCTGCKWSGEDLLPVNIRAGIQGTVKTFACPVCGQTVGGGVILQEPEKKPAPEAFIEFTSYEVVKPDPEPVSAEVKYLCQYCGRECKTQFGLASHEKACYKNPANM